MRREVSNGTLVGIVTALIVAFGLVLLLVFAGGGTAPSDAPATITATQSATH